ncbi:hypothetical protein FQN54_005457 [Arachnomyces sp. PD_36]|nr:hypothetical protein FQN54_005457 [Arachnomyces sp. PD_36]
MLPTMAFKSNGVLLVLLATLLLIPTAVTPMDLTYCSDQNTGSGFDVVTDRFQSNGACYETCVAKYAFAVLQGKSCWCSNYIPAAKKPAGSCNENCPGYPSDKCGSTSDGLFAYFALDERPSGTATGGGSPSQTTLVVSSDLGFIWPPKACKFPCRTRFSSQRPPTLIWETTYAPEQFLTAFVQSTTSAAEPETKTVTVAPPESLTTLSTSSNTNAPPTTSAPDVSVTTRGGEVVTVTVPNDAAAETGPPSGEKQGGSSLSGGAIAGIIIGVLAVVGSMFGVWLWLFCARRRREEEEEDRPNPEAHLDPTVPASAIWNGNGNGHQRGNRASQMSMMRGHHRFSVPAFTDNRMKKDAVVYGNDGRESNVSLQDNQDYSRPVLRVSILLENTSMAGF